MLPIAAAICTVGRFTAERQSRAERQHAASELDRQHGGIQRRRVAAYDRFDTLHATARRLGRIASDKPPGDKGSEGGEYNRREPPHSRIAMRPVEHGSAEALGGDGRDMESASDQSRQRPDRKARFPQGPATGNGPLPHRRAGDARGFIGISNEAHGPAGRMH